MVGYRSYPKDNSERAGVRSWSVGPRPCPPSDNLAFGLHGNITRRGPLPALQMETGDTQNRSEDHAEKLKKYFILFLVFVFPFLGIKLISGGSFGLEYVESAAWGGLSLTFIISAFAILFCFPIGVILALGRRSSLPAIKYISIGFIELWRGVPLITVLFMSAVIFPMFLPDGTFIDKLIRVLIAITLFEAAYMAEVVRGGLQALPKGQYEAAKSLGMGYWRMNALIILPQALKLVIPGIANTLLALVKDTPLIFVVGLMELAGMIGLAKTNPKWLGMAMEGYVFAGLVFWVICYAMSRYSQNLEKKLSTER